jgi:hypothetical protein
MIIKGWLLANLGFVLWRLWAAGYDLDLRSCIKRKIFPSVPKFL